MYIQGGTTYGIANISYPITFTHHPCVSLGSVLKPERFTSTSNTPQTVTSGAFLVQGTNSTTGFSCQLQGNRYWIAVGY